MKKISELENCENIMMMMKVQNIRWDCFPCTLKRKKNRRLKRSVNACEEAGNEQTVDDAPLKCEQIHCSNFINFKWYGKYMQSNWYYGIKWLLLLLLYCCCKAIIYPIYEPTTILVCCRSLILFILIKFMTMFLFLLLTLSLFKFSAKQT